MKKAGKRDTRPRQEKEPNKKKTQDKKLQNKNPQDKKTQMPSPVKGEDKRPVFERISSDKEAERILKPPAAIKLDVQPKAYEILAPAGNWEALEAAVQNGADAVYLAGQDFGARKFAGNFSRTELQEAVSYCHLRGVSVYVTVNTLVLNHEWESLKAYLHFLYQTEVDAVILQDLGVVDYVSHTYPDLPIHCSTQMSVQTVADIRFLESLGVKRVVLGREMTLADIRRAKEETNVELEVFVHGALCISVSGQCLMSSLIGGRSGNRGSCAQPCRQSYTLINQRTGEKIPAPQGNYLLSPKDLNTLHHIHEVVAAGACSLKIEGRMKRAAYVAAAVKAYATVLEAGEADASEARELIARLEKSLTVFQRGFTGGHLLGVRGATLMSMALPGNQGYSVGKVAAYDASLGKVTLQLTDDLYHHDEIQLRRGDETVGGRVERLEMNGLVVKGCHGGQSCQVNFKHACRKGEVVYKTYDAQVMQQLQDTYHKEQLTIPVTVKGKIRKGQPLSGVITDGVHQVTVTLDVFPQEALKRAITQEDVKQQLGKLGGTPYQAVDVEVTLEAGLSVPMKTLNELRRNLVEQLNQHRVSRYPHRSQRGLQPSAGGSAKTVPALPVRERTAAFTFATGRLDQLEVLLDLQPEVIYYKDLETLPQAVALTEEAAFGGQLIPEIFRLTPDGDLKKYLNIISDLQLETVLIQSVGQMIAFGEFRWVGDFNLNVVNDSTVGFLEARSFQRITLSPELNLSQIREMDLKPQRTEMLVYGGVPVMAMKHCVMAAVMDKPLHCHMCRQADYALVDRKNEVFPIVRRPHCQTEIMNSKKLLLLEDLPTLVEAGVGFFRLNFMEETPEQVKALVNLHRRGLKGEVLHTDKTLLQQLKTEGVTRGHLHRGIE
ncbi:U32 family peptidase [Anoxynatronum buryatiense]|uniref:Protease n=1 Tax=Anoxynatronum buryatiense TaxID=489973 RepID=A0AA45WTQ0_9CLOT|nr:U32 family peptidase [Anoxynatronum buryatiense]SMP43066.1 putative protease [Anoxynatronum buryatiense]